MIVGITGGIGSGKTTVVNMFKTYGIPCYVADVEAKNIIHNNKYVVAEIIKLFGAEAYVNGIYNTTYVAKQVFTNKEKLSQLNAIVHPAVAQDFLEWTFAQDSLYVVYESALLFETGNAKKCDKIITVTANLQKRIQRVKNRDGSSEEQVIARIKNQLSDTEKTKNSDYIIDNDDLQQTKKQVTNLHELLSKIALC